MKIAFVGGGNMANALIGGLLAKGYDVPEAVQRAKDYVVAALRTAPNIGHGAGPLNHSVMSDEW